MGAHQFSLCLQTKILSTIQGAKQEDDSSSRVDYSKTDHDRVGYWRGRSRPTLVMPSH